MEELSLAICPPRRLQLDSERQWLQLGTAQRALLAPEGAQKLPLGGNDHTEWKLLPPSSTSRLHFWPNEASPKLRHSVSLSISPSPFLFPATEELAAQFALCPILLEADSAHRFCPPIHPIRALCSLTPPLTSSLIWFTFTPTPRKVDAILSAAHLRPLHLSSSIFGP